MHTTQRFLVVILITLPASFIATCNSYFGWMTGFGNLENLWPMLIPFFALFVGITAWAIREGLSEKMPNGDSKP